MYNSKLFLDMLHVQNNMSPHFGPYKLAGLAMFLVLC